MSGVPFQLLSEAMMMKATRTWSLPAAAAAVEHCMLDVLLTERWQPLQANAVCAIEQILLCLWASNIVVSFCRHACQKHASCSIDQIM